MGREEVVSRIEDVATLADIEQEVEGPAMVVERVREADREVRLAIIAEIEERLRRQGVRSHGKARGGIDQ